MSRWHMDNPDAGDAGYDAFLDGIELEIQRRKEEGRGLRLVVTDEETAADE